MNDSAGQFFNLVNSLPLSKKISMAFILTLVIAGFAFMFIWANKADYQVLFNNLSPKDGGAIVSKLKERNIPYKVEANGTLIMVPAEKVYELRLVLAGDNLPRGGNVGFEIFDHTDFRTTKFVQELNYRRALQGELARTINQFKEVNSSRVFIVIPKESLFIEDSKVASASIQLDLGSSLPPGKIAAIVHLVGSAVEGLDPEQVTVVDTKGRVIFKGGDRSDTSAFLSTARLDYKRSVENEIRKNVQSMLEGILGAGKAIVRVNAEIDLESIKTSEGGAKTAQTLIDQRRGITPPLTGAQNTKTKKDSTINYEINKITRTIFKPAGKIKYLSVAAAIDGTYKLEKLKDGTSKRTYIPRSEAELKKFTDIVKMAMGYSDDREDKVSVSSMAFSEAISIDTKTEKEGFDILKLVGDYRKTIINLLLAALVFFIIVRPLLKSIKKMARENILERKELPSGTEGYPQISESREMNQKEKALETVKRSPEKTEQLLKGWIGERE
ncbi:MAG: flagellar M-ring protein FliF, partial [Deltaproteobacteria bacterium]|nr:flagellar M-ring protein FliF [Deltaproteobacteria bacterium]